MSSDRPFAVLLAAVVGVAGLAVGWARGEPERRLDRRELAWGFKIEPGDVVFQDLECGPRCDRIREVTHSPYSHVGLVSLEDGRRQVWEALGPPVGPTPLASWVERGRHQRVAVYRPTEPLLTRRNDVDAQVRAMRGLPYDPDYQWDDARIYCSELVAKAYARAFGRDLFPPHPLGPGAFGDRAGQIARLSHGRLTERTPLVSPSDLARSPLLRRLVDEL